MNYQSILTQEVKKRINDSVLAAIYEGNDSTCIEYDAFIYSWVDYLTPAEFKEFDYNEATKVIDDYLVLCEMKNGMMK